MAYKVFYTVLALVMCFCLFGIYKSREQTTTFRAACESKGGITHRGRSGLVCLKPDSVIFVER